MLTVLTPPVQTRLATLAQVEAELGLDASLSVSDEATLSVMLDGASAAIATYCHRIWGMQHLQEDLPGTGSQMLGLTGAPLLSVGAVAEDSIAITDYVVADPLGAILERDAGWYASRSMGWGSLYGGYGGGWGADAVNSGYLYPGWKRYRYSVTYWAGYLLPLEPGAAAPSGSGTWPALPADVTRACIQTVKIWSEGRSGLLIGSKRVDDVQITYNTQPVDQLAPGVQALLRQYRRGTV